MFLDQIRLRGSPASCASLISTTTTASTTSTTSTAAATTTAPGLECWSKIEDDFRGWFVGKLCLKQEPLLINAIWKRQEFVPGFTYLAHTSYLSPAPPAVPVSNFRAGVKKSWINVVVFYMHFFDTLKLWVSTTTTTPKLSRGSRRRSPTYLEFDLYICFSQ